MSLTAGLGGAARNGCVALCTETELLGVCEQERITRVKAAGFGPGGLPDEALDELLRVAARRRSEITAYATAETGPVACGERVNVLERSFMHASSAFLTSPFESATILVCDYDEPQVTVWNGLGASVTRTDFEWSGPGLADLYSRCAELAGFAGFGREQRLEALARLHPDHRDERITKSIVLENDHLRLAPGWEEQVRDLMRASERARELVSAAVQSRIGDLLVELLGSLARTSSQRPLCLGGSLFTNSYFNARARLSGTFDDVFIPVNPGDRGLAVAAAMHASGPVRQSITPFLGPSYSAEEIKATLDNCKLNYQWATVSDAIGMAVADLMKGRLVGWFEGRMEWGPRALGGRSILASPFSEYVLDNLNRFLKKRESWRGYALAGLSPAVDRWFEGPSRSPFMECDYQPRDRGAFRHILPGPSASVRVQRVGSAAPSRFRELLAAFGERSGLPVLVNTSFNGFQEPIVCSPRDAVRVFYGTGIDTLVLEQFVIRK